MGFSRRSSTAGRRSSSRTGRLPFEQKARPNHSAEQERIDYLEKKIQTKDEVLAELMAEHVALKKDAWGTLTGVWVPHDTRDQIVDFVRRWSEKTEIGAGRFIGWLDITASKFYDWRERYGKVNEHNGWVPRDFWLEDWEKQAIIGFHLKNPLEGYRRLTFMMLDADIVAVSPTSVWRVLGQAGLLSKWNGKPSKKGTGFEQPLAAHQHWHIDVSYINISGTFYYLCSILDGCSRYIVNWDLRESMTEADIEIILQRAKETSPGGAAPDHLRQRAAVHRQGLQGVHSDLGHDARQNLALLSAIERKNRTLAQIAQRRVHPAGNAAVAGRCAASGGGLRGALQQRPPEQRHRLHHAEGHAGRASAGDPRRARPEVGGGAETAADSSPASRLRIDRALLGVWVRRLNFFRFAENNRSEFCRNYIGGIGQPVPPGRIGVSRYLDPSSPTSGGDVRRRRPSIEVYYRDTGFAPSRRFATAPFV